MRYLSMFSGIEAASVAWRPLGWEAAAVCEIEPFPCAVLSHHYPEVPNLGDVTKADFDSIGAIDLAVFGSPCQSFSVAGKRLGLDDPRGNLALLAGRVVYGKRPRWFVFENVPGLLSSDGGWDFGTLLASFAGYPSGSVFAPPEGGWRNSGVVQQADGESYGLAWRVLDAQFFGVAQRRRRVFVVGYLGDWRRAAAVLFERHSLQGHPAPRREAGERAAGTLAGGARRSGGYSHDDIPAVAGTLSANGKAAGSATQQDAEQGNLVAWQATGNSFWRAGLGPLGASDDNGTNQPVCFSSKDHGADAETDLAPTLRAGGHDGSHANAGVPPAIAFGWQNSASQGASASASVTPTLDKSKTPAVAFALRGREGGAMPEIGGDHVGSLRAASGGSSRDYVAFDTTQVTSAANRSNPQAGDPCHPLAAQGHPPAIAGSAVRRLTPVECARLQGFPDDYLTSVTWRGKCPPPDGPMYRALGNSMATPVMAWIGQRIEAVEALQLEAAA